MFFPTTEGLQKIIMFTGDNAGTVKATAQVLMTALVAMPGFIPMALSHGTEV